MCRALWKNGNVKRSWQYRNPLHIRNFNARKILLNLS